MLANILFVADWLGCKMHNDLDPLMLIWAVWCPLFVNDSLWIYIAPTFFLLLCLQRPNISLMLVRVIGVSHPLCLWVSSMIQVEVTLWMILLLWRPRFLSAEWLTIGHMTRERIQVMWVWKIKELPVIWTLSYKHCTTYRTSGRCDTMHLHLDIPRTALH